MKSIFNTLALLLCYILYIHKLNESLHAILFALMIINSIFVGLYLLKQSKKAKL